MSVAEYLRLTNGGSTDADFRQQLAEVDKKIAKKSQKQVGQLEHDIQTAILNRLSYVKNGFFWRQNSGSVKNTYTNKQGEEKTRFWTAGMPGISDVLGVYKGYFVAIEVKRPGEKARPNQELFISSIRSSGGIAFLCENDAHVVTMLEQYYAYLQKTNAHS